MILSGHTDVVPVDGQDWLFGGASYAPYGVNAIEYAAQLINKLGELGAEQAQDTYHDSGFDAHTIADQLQRYAETEPLPKMQAVDTNASITMHPLSAYLGLVASPDSQVAQFLAMLSASLFSVGRIYHFIIY